jgi:putative transposase
MPPTTSVPSPKDVTTLRAAAVRRLLFLQQQHKLTHGHIRMVADALDVHTRTVRRWMDNSQSHNGVYTPAGRTRFILTPLMHDALTRWCGNVTAAYRELTDDGLLGDPPKPSLPTFHRAVRRELSAGQRAGLRGGEKARRRYDVHGQRPRGFRNDAWETDHVEASVWVNVNGEARKPWITWFIDCATDVICGVAITPQTASSESILAALRAALLRDEPYGPFGGVPRLVRVDRGKDFLCDVLNKALGALCVELVDLPPRRPDLKGTVESLNGAVKDMLFCGLPGYTDEPAVKGDKGGKAPRNLDDLLPFEAFVSTLLDWIHRWNHEHTIRELDNRTPAQAWEADLTPIDPVDPIALHTYTLKRHRTPLKISSNGVWWNKGRYIAPWMHGHVGTLVQLRHMPNHHHEVELYHATTERYLGPAYLADQATPEQTRQLRRTWQREADRLTAKRKKARKNSKARYAATTQPTAPHLLDATPKEDVLRQLRDLDGVDLAAEARPNFLPLPEPSPAWTQPDTAPPSAKTTPEPQPEPEEQP